jgi:hypothetical protein
LYYQALGSIDVVGSRKLLTNEIQLADTAVAAG